MKKKVKATMPSVPAKVRTTVAVELDENTILELAMQIVRKRRDGLSAQIKVLEDGLRELEAERERIGPPDPAIDAALTKEYGPQVE